MFITDAMNQKLENRGLPPMIKGCMIYKCGTDQYTVQIFFDPKKVKGNKLLDLSVWAMFKLLPTVGLAHQQYPAIQLDCTINLFDTKTKAVLKLTQLDINDLQKFKEPKKDEGFLANLGNSIGSFFETAANDTVIFGLDFILKKIGADSFTHPNLTLATLPFKK